MDDKGIVAVSLTDYDALIRKSAYFDMIIHCAATTEYDYRLREMCNAAYALVNGVKMEDVNAE